MTTVHLLLIDRAQYDDDSPDLRVFSAHPSDRDARLALANAILDDPGTPVVRGARIDTVELSGELAEPYDRGDRDAITSVLARYFHPKDHLPATADAIMDVVGQRIADARAMARQDAAARPAYFEGSVETTRRHRQELAEAMYGSTLSLDDKRTRWPVLLEAVRELARPAGAGRPVDYVELVYPAEVAQDTVWTEDARTGTVDTWDQRNPGNEPGGMRWVRRRDGALYIWTELLDTYGTVLLTDPS